MANKPNIEGEGPVVDDSLATLSAPKEGEQAAQDAAKETNISGDAPTTEQEKSLRDLERSELQRSVAEEGDQRTVSENLQSKHERLRHDRLEGVATSPLRSQITRSGKSTTQAGRELQDLDEQSQQTISKKKGKRGSREQSWQEVGALIEAVLPTEALDAVLLDVTIEDQAEHSGLQISKTELQNISRELFGKVEHLLANGELTSCKAVAEAFDHKLRTDSPELDEETRNAIVSELEQAVREALELRYAVLALHAESEGKLRQQVIEKAKGLAVSYYQDGPQSEAYQARELEMEMLLAVQEHLYANNEELKGEALSLYQSTFTETVTTIAQDWEMVETASHALEHLFAQDEIKVDFVFGVLREVRTDLLPIVYEDLKERTGKDALRELTPHLTEDHRQELKWIVDGDSLNLQALELKRAIEGEKDSPGTLYQWYKTTENEERERIEAHFENQHFMSQPLETLIAESSHSASIHAIRKGNILEEHVLYIEDTLRQASKARHGSHVQERFGDEVQQYLRTLSKNELEQTLTLYQERNNKSLGESAQGIFSYSQAVALDSLVQNEPHLLAVSRILEAGKSSVPLIAIYGEMKDLSFEEKREVFRLFERETGRNLFEALANHGVEGHALSREFLQKLVLGPEQEVQRELFTILAEYAHQLGVEKGELLAQKGLPENEYLLDLFERNQEDDGARLIEVTERIEELQQLMQTNLGDTAGPQIISLAIRESEQAARFESVSQYAWRFGNRVRTREGLYGEQEKSKESREAFARYLTAQDAHLTFSQNEEQALQAHYQQSYEQLDRKIESAIGHAEDVARAGKGHGTYEGDLWKALTGQDRSSVIRRMERGDHEMRSLRDAEEMTWMRRAFLDKQGEPLQDFLEYEFSGWGEGDERKLSLEYAGGRHSVDPSLTRTLSFQQIDQGMSVRELIAKSQEHSPESTFALSLQATLSHPDPIIALQELRERTDSAIVEAGLSRFKELHGKSYLDILQERFGTDGLRVIEDQNPHTGKVPTRGDTVELAGSILKTGGLSAENTSIYIQRRMLELGSLRGQAQALGTQEGVDQVALLDKRMEEICERFDAFIEQVPQLQNLYEQASEQTYNNTVLHKLQEFDQQLAIYENLNSLQSSKKGDKKLKARSRREGSNRYCQLLAERAQYAQVHIEALESISQDNEQVLQTLRMRLPGGEGRGNEIFQVALKATDELYAAMAEHQSVLGLFGGGTDEERTYSAYEEILFSDTWTEEEKVLIRSAIDTIYKQRYGEDLLARIEDEFGGAELDRALALFSGEKVEALAAEYFIRIDGAGTSGETRIHQLLEGLSQKEKVQLERVFNDRYAKRYGARFYDSLDADLGGDDLKKALAHWNFNPESPRFVIARQDMNGHQYQEPFNAALYAIELHDAITGLTDDEFAIGGVLDSLVGPEGNLDPEKIARVKEAYFELYERSLESKIRNDLGGTAKDWALSVVTLTRVSSSEEIQEAQYLSKTYKIRYCMEGAGTYDKELQKATNLSEKRQEIIATAQREFALASHQENEEGMQVALKKIEGALVAHQNEMKEVEKLFQLKLGRNLREDLRHDLDGKRGEVYGETLERMLLTGNLKLGADENGNWEGSKSLLIAQGQSFEDEVIILRRAVRGGGTDEAALRQVLVHSDGTLRTKAQIEELKSRYKARYDRELEYDLRHDLSGTDRFDLIEIALRGEPETEQEMIEMARLVHEFEREGKLFEGSILRYTPAGFAASFVDRSTVQDLFSFTQSGDLYDKEFERLESLYAKIEKGTASAEEHSEFTKLFQQSRSTSAVFRVQKDMAADAIANGATTVVVVGGCVLASGVTGGGSLALMAIYVSSASLAVRAGVKTAFRGSAGYGLEDFGADSAVSALDGLTMIGGAHLGRAASKGFTALVGRVGAKTAVTQTASTGVRQSAWQIALARGEERMGRHATLNFIRNVGVDSAVDGAGSAAVMGVYDVGLRAETWQHGLSEGLMQLWGAAKSQAAFGAMMGVGFSGAMALPGGLRSIKNGTSRARRPVTNEVTRDILNPAHASEPTLFGRASDFVKDMRLGQEAPAQRAQTLTREISDLKAKQIDLEDSGAGTLEIARVERELEIKELEMRLHGEAYATIAGASSKVANNELASQSLIQKAGTEATERFQQQALEVTKDHQAQVDAELKSTKDAAGRKKIKEEQARIAQERAQLEQGVEQTRIEAEVARGFHDKVMDSLGDHKQYVKDTKGHPNGPEVAEARFHAELRHTEQQLRAEAIARKAERISKSDPELVLERQALEEQLVEARQKEVDLENRSETARIAHETAQRVVPLEKKFTHSKEVTQAAEDLARREAMYASAQRIAERRGVELSPQRVHRFEQGIESAQAMLEEAKLVSQDADKLLKGTRKTTQARLEAEALAKAERKVRKLETETHEQQSVEFVEARADVAEQRSKLDRMQEQQQSSWQEVSERSAQAWEKVTRRDRSEIRSAENALEASRREYEAIAAQQIQYNQMLVEQQAGGVAKTAEQVKRGKRLQQEVEQAAVRTSRREARVEIARTRVEAEQTLKKHAKEYARKVEPETEAQQAAQTRANLERRSEVLQAKQEVLRRQQQAAKEQLLEARGTVNEQTAQAVLADVQQQLTAIRKQVDAVADNTHRATKEFNEHAYREELIRPARKSSKVRSRADEIITLEQKLKEFPEKIDRAPHKEAVEFLQEQQAKTEVELAQAKVQYEREVVAAKRVSRLKLLGTDGSPAVREIAEDLELAKMDLEALRESGRAQPDREIALESTIQRKKQELRQNRYAQFLELVHGKPQEWPARGEDTPISLAEARGKHREATVEFALSRSEAKSLLEQRRTLQDKLVSLGNDVPEHLENLSQQLDESFQEANARYIAAEEAFVRSDATLRGVKKRERVLQKHSRYVDEDALAQRRLVEYAKAQGDLATAKALKDSPHDDIVAIEARSAVPELQQAVRTTRAAYQAARESLRMRANHVFRLRLGPEGTFLNRELLVGILEFPGVVKAADDYVTKATELHAFREKRAAHGKRNDLSQEVNELYDAQQASLERETARAKQDLRDITDSYREAYEMEKWQRSAGQSAVVRDALEEAIVEKQKILFQKLQRDAADAELTLLQNEMAVTGKIEGHATTEQVTRHEELVFEIETPSYAAHWDVAELAKQKYEVTVEEFKHAKKEHKGVKGFADAEEKLDVLYQARVERRKAQVELDHARLRGEDTTATQQAYDEALTQEQALELPFQTAKAKRDIIHDNNLSLEEMEGRELERVVDTLAETEALLELGQRARSVEGTALQEKISSLQEQLDVLVGIERDAIKSLQRAVRDGWTVDLETRVSEVLQRRDDFFSGGATTAVVRPLHAEETFLSELSKEELDERSQAIVDDIHKLERLLGDGILSNDAKRKVRDLIETKKKALPEVDAPRVPQETAEQAIQPKTEVASTKNTIDAEAEAHLRRTKREIERQKDQLKAQSEQQLSQEGGFSFEELAGDTQPITPEANAYVDDLLQSQGQASGEPQVKISREQEILQEQARLYNEIESLQTDLINGKHSEAAQSVIEEEIAIRKSKERRLKAERSDLQAKRGSDNGENDSGDSSFGDGGGDIPSGPRPAQGGGGADSFFREAQQIVDVAPRISQDSYTGRSGKEIAQEATQQQQQVAQSLNGDSPSRTDGGAIAQYSQTNAYGHTGGSAFDQGGPALKLEPDSVEQAAPYAFDYSVVKEGKIVEESSSRSSHSQDAENLSRFDYSVLREGRVVEESSQVYSQNVELSSNLSQPTTSTQDRVPQSSVEEQRVRAREVESAKGAKTERSSEREIRELFAREDHDLVVNEYGEMEFVSVAESTLSKGKQEEDVFYVTEDGGLEVRTRSGEVRSLTERRALEESALANEGATSKDSDLYGDDSYQSTIDEITEYNRKMEEGDYDFLQDDSPDFGGEYGGEGGDWPSSGGGSGGGASVTQPTPSSSQAYSPTQGFDQGGPALKLQPEPQKTGVAVLEPPQAKASAAETTTLQPEVEAKVRVHELEEVTLTPEEEAIAQQMVEELALQVKPQEAPQVKPTDAPSTQPTKPQQDIQEDVSAQLREELDLKLKPHAQTRPEQALDPSPVHEPAPETKPDAKEEPMAKQRRLRRMYGQDSLGDGGPWQFVDRDITYTMSCRKWELDKLDGVRPYNNIAGKKIIKKVKGMLGEYETFHWHYT